MHPNFKILSEQSKAELKDRIIDSLSFEHKAARSRKRNLLSFGVAAVLCTGLGITALLKHSNKKTLSPIEQFAQSSAAGGDAFQKDGKVKLVLSNKQSLTVADSTTIAYDASGNKINLNNKQIQQAESSQLQYNTVLVPYGKRAHLSLADGTLVWLNSGSKLIYPASFDDDTREVFLEGEGIFDVAHKSGRPFFVKAANNYSVRVLGTLFNVSCYAKDAKISTALLRGKVQVAYIKKGVFDNDTVQSVLKPGMIAALDKKQQTIKTVSQNVDPLFAWRKGHYEFYQEKLPVVLDKLTRYYNVDFVINKKAGLDETYSGAFKLNDDLDKVIKTLEATTGFELAYNARTREITIN